MNIIEIVQDINGEAWQLYKWEIPLLEYRTNGLSEGVWFGDHYLWHSEDDEREWIEAENDYEPMKEFLKKQYNKYIYQLKSMPL